MERKKTIRKEDDEQQLDPIYHSIANINGRINKMSKAELQKCLNQNGLHQKGVKEVLQRRLKNFYKKQKLQSVSKFEDEQFYKYLVVIDFEATCEERNPTNYLHEIIEFPAVLIDVQSLTIVDEFHSYCQPMLNPILSQFCMSLTGITQVDVNKAPEFPLVLEDFEKWLESKNILSKWKTAFITDGSWDFSKFLNIQCCLNSLQYPKWAKRWINLKKIYGNFYKLNKPKIMEMLSNLGMEFEGRHHCGLHDARNIAKIVLRLLQDNCILQINEKLSDGHLFIITEAEKNKLKKDFALRKTNDSEINITELCDEFTDL